jgi:HSP20 family molecular chaperone IbpA
MATPKRAATSKASVATAPRIVSKSEADGLNQAIREHVADRAYQLYEASGYAAGRDQEHWLQAESEVLRHELEVRESGSWVTMQGSLPEVAAQGVEIYVDARRVIVRAQRREKAQTAEAPMGGAGRELFWAADLETEVDPATASASLKDGKLTLTVKKRNPAQVPPISFADAGER